MGKKCSSCKTKSSIKFNKAKPKTWVGMKGMLAVETDELFAVELSSVEDVEVAGVVRVGFI